MRARFLASACLGLLAGSQPATSFAWQILTPVSKPCHELITLSAFGEPRLGVVAKRFEEMKNLRSIVMKRIEEVGVPESRENRRFLQEVAERFELRNRSNEEIWFLASVIAGVRHPDTRGYATLKAQESRFTHLTNDSQAAHSLRRTSEDGEAGNASSVNESKRLILQTARTSHEQWWTLGAEEGKISTTWTFPFYGDNVFVRVHAPTYTLALSTHTIQDSFAHTLRDDSGAIVAVGNYVELITGRRKEGRDGPGHSDRLDQCELKTDFDRARFQRAVDATADFALATLATWQQPTFDDTEIVASLGRTFAYKKGCTVDNGYCGSPWVPFANEKITTPIRLMPGCGVIAMPLDRTPEGPLDAEWGLFGRLRGALFALLLGTPLLFAAIASVRARARRA